MKKGKEIKFLDSQKYEQSTPEKFKLVTKLMALIKNSLNTDFSLLFFYTIFLI